MIPTNEQIAQLPADVREYIAGLEAEAKRNAEALAAAKKATVRARDRTREAEDALVDVKAERDDLREEIAPLEHGAEDPCICEDCRIGRGSREDIAGLWRAIGRVRLVQYVAGENPDGEKGAERAWRAADGILAAGRMEPMV